MGELAARHAEWQRHRAGIFNRLVYGAASFASVARDLGCGATRVREHFCREFSERDRLLRARGIVGPKRYDYHEGVLAAADRLGDASSRLRAAREVYPALPAEIRAELDRRAEPAEA